jgi:hypothetical protein
MRKQRNILNSKPGIADKHMASRLDCRLVEKYCNEIKARKTMIATTIDLSKIPVKEMPRKLVKANFGDGEKEYWIRSLGDADRMCVQMLYSGDADVMRPYSLYVLLLTAGLEAIGGNQETAKWLVKHCTDAAQAVGNEIYTLTIDFYKAKDVEVEQAEKNSPPEASASEAPAVTQA